MTLPMLPLLLLLTALGSILLYHRTYNQIYGVLAASLAIVCLIWGFAIAHWSVHLLCLAFLLKYKELPFVGSGAGSSQ